MNYQHWDLISKLQSKYELIIDPIRTTDTTIYLRSTIDNGADASKFVKTFCEVTNTNFIVFSCIYKPRRIIYHKTWKCHLNRPIKILNSEGGPRCNATIDIKVKKVNRSTKRNDGYLKMIPPLTGVIIISPQHNHSVDSPERLRNLRIRHEAKEKFIEFFNDGLGVGAARQLNMAQLLLKNSPKSLINGSLNPSYRALHYVYITWKKKSSKDFDPIQRLVEKLPSFEDKGTDIKICQSLPWAIIIITPVMRRAQTHAHIREMFFVDSFYKAHYTVTMLLTATKAGVIPIAVLIQENESYHCYCNGFQLVKDMCPSLFEESEKGLTVFLTINCEAAKSAIRVTWPYARLLLCQYHLILNEWKSLQLAESNVPKEHRMRLMKKFLVVLRAETKEELEASSKIVLEDKRHGTYRNHFMQLFNECQREWVTCHRSYLKSDSNSNTNNFAETTIKVLRHTIIEFSKKLNLVGFAEFCSSVLDEFLVQKLQIYQYDDHSHPVLFYDDLESRVFDNYVMETQTDNESFIIYKQGTEFETFLVNSAEGSCTCFIGETADYCEHQYFVYKSCNRRSPNLPSISRYERYCLVKMAVGNECPHINSFV